MGTLILATIVLFGTFIAMIGIGLLLQGKEIKGSCGGPRITEDGMVTCCKSVDGSSCESDQELSALQRQGERPANQPSA